MKKSPTTENIYELFNIIQTQIMTPLMNSSGSGKSTLPILQAAHKLDIPFIHLSNGIYQLGWGSQSRRINRSIIDTDSAIGSQMSQNKIVTAMLLRNAGLPAPEHALVVSLEEAQSIVKELGWPIVVKPADLDRGEGVTVDVTSDELLLKAFSVAQELSLSKQVIIERQVEGVCCRIFIANEKMLYAVKRLPKSVKGDGLQSVKALIEEANKLESLTPPWQRGEHFPDDALAIEAMQKAGFRMDSVPNQAQLIPLRKIESTQWGGVDEDIINTIHPDNLDIALRAAKLFGLQVCGIDIITSDISTPWHKNGAIINEVNFSPLLGGGDISKQMIPAYLQEFIDGDGRIPITVIVGDEEAMNLAQEIQKEQLLLQKQCFISTHDKTISAKNEEVHFISQSLYQRCKSLLFDTKVDSLILVVQTDEFLSTGLPIDRVDKIIVASQDLKSWKNSEEKLSNEIFDNIVKLLALKIKENKDEIFENTKKMTQVSIEQYAIEAFQSNDFEKLKIMGQDYIKIYPHESFGYKCLGIALRHTDNIESAIHIMHQGVQHNPNDTESWLNLAKTLIDIFRYEDAKKILILASEAIPFSFEILSELGTLLINLNEIEQANNNLEKAYNLNPKHLSTALHYANGLGIYSEFEKAINILQATNSLFPNDTEVHLYLASIYQKQHNIESALQYYRKALTLVLTNSKKLKMETPTHNLQNSIDETMLWKTLVLLKKHNIQAFSASGTLLGLTRDNALLPNDKDIDIGFAMQEMDKVIHILCQNGWEEYHNSYHLKNPRVMFHRKTHLICDLCGYDIKADKAITGLWLDAKGLNPLNRVTQFSVQDLSLTTRQTPLGDVWHLKYPQDYLEKLYGKEWKIPNSLWDTIIMANNLKDFTILTECYSLNRLIEALSARNYKKGQIITEYLKHYRNDIDQYLEIENYWNKNE